MLKTKADAEALVSYTKIICSNFIWKFRVDFLKNYMVKDAYLIYFKYFKRVFLS